MRPEWWSNNASRNFCSFSDLERDILISRARIAQIGRRGVDSLGGFATAAWLEVKAHTADQQVDRRRGAARHDACAAEAFDERGRAKLELAPARGKKLYDRRGTGKKRLWQRERGRLLRQKA